MQSDPFRRRAMATSGPARDVAPVTPDDAADLPEVAVALYVETGGALSFRTPHSGDVARTIRVGDNQIVPVGATRVMATGTDAQGVHALIA